MIDQTIINRLARKIKDIPPFPEAPQDGKTYLRKDGAWVEVNYIVAPESNTDNYIPQWDGADSKTLKNGVMLDTNNALAGNSDSRIPTQKAVKAYVDGQRKYCRAYRDSDVSIATSSWTTIAFNKESFDNDAMHSNTTNNSRITIKTAGKYAFGGQVQFATSSTGMRAVQVLLNGTTSLTRQQTSASSAGRTALYAGGIYQFAVNDYIELQAYQNRGSSLDTDTSDLELDLWAYKIAD